MIGIFAAIALAGYTIALVALLLTARATTGRPGAPLWFLSAAMALMVLVSTSNTLEHLEITAALDRYEDYAEILFLPLVAYGLYGYLITSQGAHVESARRAAESEHHLLLEIVENAPIGIAIVDRGGRIAYANPETRALLDLEDDDAIMGYSTPGRVWREDSAEEPEGILPVNPGESLEGARFIYRSPDVEIPLIVSAAPLHPDPPHGASVVMLRRAREG